MDQRHPDSSTPPTAEPGLATGVNYIGFLRSELGLGEAARGYYRCLKKAGIRARWIDVSRYALNPRGKYPELLLSKDKGASPDNRINIVHVNPDMLPTIHDVLGEKLFRDHYNIGVWAWETLQFPEKWRSAFSLFHEIWALSTFTAQSLSPVSPIPVIHMPLLVSVPDISADRAAFGIDANEFVFLFVFDFNSALLRKNPAGLIRAFKKAFHPQEPVRLILKSMNASLHKDKYAQLQALVGDARITFLDRTLDSHGRYALMASCDALVSLHRAEGFGLNIAEAMAMGKPVIATGWSGNMDFMNANNALAVKYSLIPMESSDGHYEAGTLWAEPDEEDAAQLMRQLYDEPGLREKLQRQAKIDIRASTIEDAITVRIMERINGISKTEVPQRCQYPMQPNYTINNTRSLAKRIYRNFLSYIPNRYRISLQRRIAALLARTPKI